MRRWREFLLKRRWLWILLICPACTFALILCVAYLGTARLNEQTLAWMDAAHDKGLPLGMWKVCPIAAARPYPVLRKMLERPILSTWFDTIDDVEAFDSLPPCPVRLRIYAMTGADQAVKDAVSARQQNASLQ
jgi:hypothetical protein